MARAEHTGVNNIIRVETCGHYMCSCKAELSDEPAEIFVAVENVVGDASMHTSLRLMDAGPDRSIDIKGIRRSDEVIEEFSVCEAPEITATGVVCGAVHKLGRI